ncbi:MAG: hypothetical protein ACI9OJ_005016 [Myxococcota bacterium]|jgi:hypothetical protein
MQQGLCSTRWPLAVAAIVAVTAVLPAHHAEAQSDGLEPSLVFFELYLRDDPLTKTPEYVAGVQQEIRQFNRFSILSRSDASQRIRSTMITPAKRVNDARLKAIGAMVAEGDKLAYTNPKKAIAVLRKAKSELKDLVENIGLDGQIRKDYFTTQMLLVRSHLDNGNKDKARDIMGEIVKVFEDEFPVTTKSYHPRVVQLYEDVSRDLKGLRTASVTITTNPPACDVFINGRPMRQKTPYTYKGLYPGSVRVSVRRGQLQSMVRKVELTANAAAKLDVDLEYEAAMTFDDETFGLTLSSEASRKRNMLNYAVKLGRFLNVDYVALIGAVMRGGQPMLTGYLVDTKNKSIVRSKDFDIKANVVSNRRIAEMTLFVADVDPNARPDVVYKPWYTNWIGWTLAGTGLVLGGVSGAFYGKFAEHKSNAEDTSFGSKSDRTEQANLGNDALTTAGILVGVGAASLVASILVFTLVEFEDEDANRNAFGIQQPPFMAAPWVTPDGGAGFSTVITF